jgi:hypothetical protein
MNIFNHLIRDGSSNFKSSLIGDLGTYSSNGFAVSFDNNTNKTLYIINILINNNWIDLRTSALIIEFIIFNPQNQYFSYGSYFFEFFIGGKIFTNGVISTVKLDIYSGKNSTSIIICQILSIFAILALSGFVVSSTLHDKTFYKVCIINYINSN